MPLGLKLYNKKLLRLLVQPQPGQQLLMWRVQHLNVQLPHSATPYQHQQLSAKSLTYLGNALLVQANDKAVDHPAHLAQGDRGILLRLAQGHALALKCTGNLSDALL
jgi:hypothetical protein